MKKLLKYKIQTRNFFYPMHKQKVFLKMKIFSKRSKYPNSEYLSNYGFYLPSGISIKNYEIDYICDVINSIIS